MTDAWDSAAHQRVMEALCVSFYGTSWSDTSVFRRGICESMAVAALTALGPCLTPAEITRLRAEVARLREAIMAANNLLAERVYGNAARSPGHNARLLLERAIAGEPTP